MIFLVIIYMPTQHFLHCGPQRN
ncbi:rCG42872 [Rattus norvegicus]|uniref:RCG42872 n=1 Tax=Rattus norvegicus TaxID=10116 RepID=A6K024_RAT|nr:rCG42872 [Rattus norvegicus]